MKLHLASSVLLIGLLATSLHAVDAPPSATPAKPQPAVRPAFSEEVLKTYDKDGDGKLNDAELRAMLIARREKAAAARREKLEQETKEFDTDGDGKLSEAEVEAMRAKQVERIKAAVNAKYDADGDGKLNDAELQKKNEDAGRRFKALRRERMQKVLAQEGPARDAFIKRFDKDGDGKLSDAELEAAVNATPTPAKVEVPAKVDRPAPAAVPSK